MTGSSGVKPNIILAYIARKDPAAAAGRTAADAWNEYLSKLVGGGLISSKRGDLERLWLRSRGAVGETLTDLWSNFLTLSVPAAPTLAAFTAGAGTLVTGTYYYKVSAVNAFGEGLPSAEGSLAITGPAGVNVNWVAVTGATSYKVYGRTTGGELLMATVTAPTVTFLDGGSATPAGAIPAQGGVVPRSQELMEAINNFFKYA